jgi:hypothetical protein
MRKLLLAAVALPTLAGAASAEPLSKLDERGLAGVAAGQTAFIVDFSFSTAMATAAEPTTVIQLTTAVQPSLNSNPNNTSLNSVYAVGFGLPGTSAIGSSTATVINSIPSGGGQ